MQAFVEELDGDGNIISRPIDIPRHPFSVFRHALEREARIIAKLNRTFVTGDFKYRDRLFKIFFENETLKEHLIDLMRANIIKTTWNDRGLH